jgi:hypothetical protein
MAARDSRETGVVAELSTYILFWPITVYAMIQDHPKVLQVKKKDFAVSLDKLVKINQI